MMVAPVIDKAPKQDTRPATGHTTTTPLHRAKGEPFTPPAPRPPRRDPIPQRPPRRHGTNCSWFEAGSEHDLFARSPREERRVTSPKCVLPPCVSLHIMFVYPEDVIKREKTRKTSDQP
ncbi:hypothetical protein ISCGN_013030 [Ixodes scapularis]